MIRNKTSYALFMVAILSGMALLSSVSCMSGSYHGVRYAVEECEELSKELPCSFDKAWTVIIRLAARGGAQFLKNDKLSGIISFTNFLSEDELKMFGTGKPNSGGSAAVNVRLERRRQKIKISIQCSFSLSPNSEWKPNSLYPEMLLCKVETAIMAHQRYHWLFT